MRYTFRRKSENSQKIFKIPKMRKIVPKSGQKCFQHFLGFFSNKKLCPVLHGWFSLRKSSKKCDHGKLIRLPTKCYVKNLNEKIFMENMKNKYYDNSVVSFTKKAVSCECHHRDQFF